MTTFAMLAVAVVILALAASTAEAGSKAWCGWPGSACNDPVFVGSDGVEFYFHGHKDADFCIVSDSNLHVNAHFIGKREEGVHRDYTWVQSLGILFDDHQLYVGANKVAIFDNSKDHFTLSLDASPVLLPPGRGAIWKLPFEGVQISRVDEHNGLDILVENQFKLTVRIVPVSQEENLKHKYGITADNCFAHLELNFQFQSLTSSVSGVLGQTYAPGFKHEEKKSHQLIRTLSGESSYLSSSLMSTDCAVSKFAGVTSGQISLDLPHTSCTGTGTGLVCRR